MSTDETSRAEFEERRIVNVERREKIREGEISEEKREEQISEKLVRRNEKIMG